MIRTRLQGDTPFFPNMLNNGMVEVCLKEDVDKVIVEKDAEIARLKDRSLDVKDAAHVLKAFKFYLCQLTHCAYDERTAQKSKINY